MASYFCLTNLGQVSEKKIPPVEEQMSPVQVTGFEKACD